MSARRSERSPARKPGVMPEGGLAVVPEDATGAAAKSTKPTPLKLPHEKDESAERDTQPARPEIRQGAADLEAGQQDTDCYTTAAPNFARRSTKPR